MTGQDRSKKEKPSEEFQNFQRLLENTLAVPKEELDKRRNEYERARADRNKGKS